MTKVAAGFLIFRRFSGTIEYLMLQTSYGENHWTPPKGHLKKGESDMEAAYRETLEESGLSKSDFIVYENEKYTLNYIAKGKPKTCHYWLAELTKDIPIRLSDEHVAYRWVALREAIEHAKYEELIKMLNDSDLVIKQKYS